MAGADGAGFGFTLPGFPTGHYRVFVLLPFRVDYRISSGEKKINFTRFLPSVTGFYWVFITFYRISRGFMGL